MKDKQQINTIQQALSSQKELLVANVSNINMTINKKLVVLKKFIEYQKEYTEAEQFRISRSIPTLVRNLEVFTGKIAHLIRLEEKEVEDLVKKRYAKLEEILKIEQKLKLMQHFLTVIQSEQDYELSKMEQRVIDDMASIKYSRGDYE
jgi:hypothetical protein